MAAATDYYTTASDIILKEWNGFGFKFIEEEDHPKVMAQLRQNFFLDEPISKCTGMTPERMEDLNVRVPRTMGLRHGSFYAFPLQQPDTVACVLIIWFQFKDLPRPQMDESLSPITSLVRRAVLKLHSRYNIHEKHGIDTYPDLFILSTDRRYRGHGLATEMYKKAIAKFKAQGYPLVSSTFTNPLSRKIGEKLGFREVARLDFTETLPLKCAAKLYIAKFKAQGYPLVSSTFTNPISRRLGDKTWGFKLCRGRIFRKLRRRTTGVWNLGKAAENYML